MREMGFTLSDERLENLRKRISLPNFNEAGLAMQFQTMGKFDTLRGAFDEAGFPLQGGLLGSLSKQHPLNQKLNDLRAGAKGLGFMDTPKEFGAVDQTFKEILELMREQLKESKDPKLIEVFTQALSELNPQGPYGAK